MHNVSYAKKIRPWVVKIGGRLCEDPEVRRQFAESCREVTEPLVIVHGGGVLVTKMQQTMGITPRFHEGRRMTSPEEMAIVEMALSGSINKSMVRALNQFGLHAVGISGCDAELVQARLVPDLGAVGEPEIVNADIIHTLLSAGHLPVVSPVSLSGDGTPVNVNADEVACALAMELAAARLLLVSDVSGVRVAGENRPEIFADEIEHLIEIGEVTGGMIPKLRAAAMATARGVGEVVITGFSGSMTKLAGTSIRARSL